MARLVRLSGAALLVFISVAVTSFRPFDIDSLAGEEGLTDTPLVIFGAAKIRGPLARAARRGVAKLGRNVTKTVRRIGRQTGLRLLRESGGHKPTDSHPSTNEEQPAVVPAVEEFLSRDSRQQHKSRPALFDRKGLELGTLRPSGSVSAHNKEDAITTKTEGSHGTTKSEKKQRPRYVGQTTVVVDGDEDATKNNIFPLRRLQTTFTPVTQEATQGPRYSSRQSYGTVPSYNGHSDYSRSAAPYSQQLQTPSSGTVFPFPDPVGSVASIVNSMSMPTYPGRSVYPGAADWVQRGTPSMFTPALPQEGLASIANSVVQTLAAGPQALFRGQIDGAAANDIWGFGDLGNVLARNTNNLLQTVGVGSLPGLGIPLW
ncbi:hypothetical protein TGPRC2_234940 [Toxoplasma gondii TgCatPRC2]|uniref:Transmembrane protein n=4 Tax=Toxoplasma gondii TaxID=5811 RepID=A0A151HQB8_TOXGO|nr:hypothetical protein TGME49_234940 [Toxoplasma gondii ME49]EPT26766.1 hypothetical protein TGME49_234940 [Toxoplasma gondii ME49]KFG46034.1 hypothetical protein TGDOM2_234940 [Toxoplasma gondii GAB2-2007-GAL-DOM2]KYF42373.1 hypothetical protein TGARI_234940 [Toxoplasma gondii ARI]KYK71543.1 hypothetical protein TGPRC2_234940 [Toxoplasma gondii TgCatPRC2]|eukprot:XP_002368909.1 hypothetical protein TGME49_234940 [Toxoplasma gondii ME49]